MSCITAFWRCFVLIILPHYSQVLERAQIIEKYHEVTAQLEQALSAIPLEKLDISDEVKEQVTKGALFLI